VFVLQRLHAVKGLSEAKADKMLEAAKKLTTAGSWISGAEAMQKVSVRENDSICGTSVSSCGMPCTITMQVALWDAMLMSIDQ
jgi:hypothetical protein